jgi:hypothetical protein
MMMLSQECFLKVYQKTHEILICIKKSKNDKASGDNMVRNEVIKSTSDGYLSLYLDLFNLTFKSGIVPDTWLAVN